MFREECDGGGDGGGGKGKIEDGGTEPEGDAAEKTGDEEGETRSPGRRGEAEGREKKGKDERGGGGEVESMVVRTEGMEVPKEGNSGGKDDEGGNKGGNTTVEEEPQGREKEKAEKREENAPCQFEGVGRRYASGFKGGSDAAEEPDGKLGPVDGATARGVVHAGEAHAGTGGFPEVPGVGEPSVGVGVDKEAGRTPRGRCGKVGGVGGGAEGEEGGGAVEESRHAAEPKGEEENGKMAEESFHGGECSTGRGREDK